MKRGSLSIQFNWIFILIAGAVLFAFFIGITMYQGDQAKKERQYNSLVNFEATLSNIEQSVTNSKESFRTFQVNGAEFENICDDIISEIKVRDSDFSFPSTTSIMFSKEYLEPGSKDVWVSNWDAPFRVSPFVFMDDRGTAFIFWGNEEYENGELNKLNDAFPKGFSKYNITGPNDPIFNNIVAKRYVIITMQSTISWGKGVDGEFKLINIIPDSGSRFEGGGKIDFYELTSESQAIRTGSSRFLKRESVFGAIFAENKEMYDCNMRKAVSRLKWLAEFHHNKAKELKANTVLTDSCNSAHYINTITQLSSLQTITIANMDTFNDKTSTIDELNADLVKRSCPVIY